MPRLPWTRGSVEHDQSPMKQLRPFGPWRTTLSKWPPEWLEEWEERAAIIQYMAGESKLGAEWLAFTVVKDRLDAEERLLR